MYTVQCTVPSKAKKQKILFFVGVFKANDENSRIWIHYSEARIRSKMSRIRTHWLKVDDCKVGIHVKWMSWISTEFLIGHRAPVSLSQRGKTTNENGRKRRRGRERRGEGWKKRRRSRRLDSHKRAFQSSRPSSLKVSHNNQIGFRYWTALLICIQLCQYVRIRQKAWIRIPIRLIWIRNCGRSSVADPGCLSQIRTFSFLGGGGGENRITGARNPNR